VEYWLMVVVVDRKIASTEVLYSLLEKITGGRIREIRKTKNMSIVELANRVGVSKSLISQVERGSVFPSLSTLEGISVALEVEITEFFKIDAPTTMEDIVVRADSRKKITLPDSLMTYYLLTPTLRKNVEFLLIEIPPFTSKDAAKGEIETFKHEGEEYFFVMEGRLELHFGHQRYILNQGDSGCFNSSNGHVWRNISDQKGVFLIAATSHIV
jgi:transcriptional regulator with XRE-family HTH domain